MKKKLLTLAMAAVMVVSSAINTFAATVADVEASGWWVAHSAGIEVTEEGVEVTFTNTTDASAANNWNGPIFVLYSADAAFAGSDADTTTADTVNTVAGYNEYWVQRGDNYGWGNATYYGVTGDLNTNLADALTTAGITWTPDADAVWDNFLTDLKAGVECKCTAKLVGDNAVLTFSVAGVDAQIELPVDTSKTTYLSISGELTTITDIEYSAMASAGADTDTDADTNTDSDADTNTNTNGGATTPDTGDSTMVVALAVVAMVAAVVVLKKRTVTE